MKLNLIKQSLIVASLLSSSPQDGLADTILSANGYPWDISNTTGLVADGGNDAFDGFGYLTMYSSPTSSGSIVEDLRLQRESLRHTTTTLVLRQGLRVDRQLDVMEDTDYVRYFDTFINSGSTPLSAEVSWGGTLGSDYYTTWTGFPNGTFIRRTGSGDTEIQYDDGWIVTSDKWGYDPVVAFVPGDRSIRDRPIRGVGRYFQDRLFWRYTFQVPPGQSASLVTFVYRGLSVYRDNPRGQRTNLTSEVDRAAAVASSLANKPDLRGLTAEQVGRIVNFSGIGTDLEAVDFSLSTPNVAEGPGTGAVIGGFAGSGPALGVPLTYELVEGTGDEGNQLFSLLGNQLIHEAQIDFEASNRINIRVRATAGNGISAEKVIVITVEDDRQEDADGDGLSEMIEEDIHGTSDLRSDSDGDGVNDPTEVSFGSDPTDASSLPASKLVHHGIYHGSMRYPGSANGSSAYQATASGRYIIIPNRKFDEAGRPVTTLQVFERETRELHGLIREPESSERISTFGEVMATANGRLLVGASDSDVGEFRKCGRAYLFDLETLALLAIYEAPAPFSNQDFGAAVALDASHALVASRDEIFLIDLANGGMTEIHKSRNGPAYPSFQSGPPPITLHLPPGHIAIAQSNSSPVGLGEVRILNRATTVQEVSIHADSQLSPHFNDSHFGAQLAVDGQYVYILDPFNDVPDINLYYGPVSTDRGAVFRFDMNSPTYPTAIIRGNPGIDEHIRGVRLAGNEVELASFRGVSATLHTERRSMDLQSVLGNEGFPTVAYGSVHSYKRSYDAQPVEGGWVVRPQEDRIDDIRLEPQGLIPAGVRDIATNPVIYDTTTVGEVLSSIFVASDSGTGAVNLAFVPGIGDDHNDLFSISGTNELILNHTPNPAQVTNYSIRLRATPTVGAQLEKVITFSLLEDPTVDLDMDGLDRQTERFFDSNETLADSDDDGIDDFREVFAGQAPGGEDVRSWDLHIEDFHPDDVDFNSNGGSVATGEDFHVLGVPFATTSEGKTGAAYVYRAIDGNRISLPMPVGIETGDRFGEQVATDGEVIAVASQRFGEGVQFNFSSSTRGAVFLYRKVDGDWLLFQTILRTTGSEHTGGGFGQSLAIDGEHLVVSAPNYNGSSTGSAGAVYYYRLASGFFQFQQAILPPSANEAGFGFGTGLDVDGSSLAVGSTGGDLFGNFSGGKVRTYEFNGASWLQTQELVPEDIQVGDEFGRSVSLNGDRLAVGSPRDVNKEQVETGSVTIYRRTAGTWEESEVLTPYAGWEGEQFGTVVSLSTSLLAVGSRFRWVSTQFSRGAVHVYGEGVEGFEYRTILIGDDRDQVLDFIGGVAATDNGVICGTPKAYGPDYTSKFSAYRIAAPIASSGGLTEALEAAGLTGSDALPEAIPFDDGVENILKYAFNMNLAGPDASKMSPGGTSGLPGGNLVEVEGQTYWRVEFVRRKDSGLIYTPLKSGNLDSFLPMTGTPAVTDIDAEWERVTIDEPCDPATETRCFSRVRVEIP